MGKASSVDRAIAALKADRAVIDLAIAKLEAQSVSAPKAGGKARKGKVRQPGLPADEEAQS